MSALESAWRTSLSEGGADVPRVALDRTVHLDVRVVRVGLLGYGRIGQAVAQLARDEHERLWQSGVELRCVRALVRDLSKERAGPPVRLSTDPAAVLAPGLDVVVEVLGGVEPARTLVASALRAGVPVVTANKTLMATCGLELRALAERHQTALAFDAAVLAGVPFLGSLARRPLVSAARRVEGIINGTSHFITGAIERGASFDTALAEAETHGYAEPDSAADTSGRDAAEKLTILLHLAGCSDVRVADLPCTGLEGLQPADFTGAHALGGTIKPVSIAALEAGAAGAWVGPAFVAGEHPFARLDGVANALQLTDARGRRVLFAGPGAGPEATAVTIIDDIVEALASGSAGAPVPTVLARGRVPAAVLREPAPCSWFVRASVAPAKFDRVLAGRLSITRRADVAGAAVALTVPASWRVIRDAIAALESNGVRAIALPAI